MTVLNCCGRVVVLVDDQNSKHTSIRFIAFVRCTIGVKWVGEVFIKDPDSPGHGPMVECRFKVVRVSWNSTIKITQDFQQQKNGRNLMATINWSELLLLVFQLVGAWSSEFHRTRFKNIYLFIVGVNERYRKRSVNIGQIISRWVGSIGIEVRSGIDWSWNWVGHETSAL